MEAIFLLVLAYGAAIVIAVVGSLLASAIIFKGTTRIAVLSALTVAWSTLYFQKVYKPNVAIPAWRAEAVRRCEAELSKLPADFKVDGFVDEGGAMRSRVILQLFAERKLRFIEIRPRQDSSQVHIGYPNGQYAGGPWAPPDLSAPYVRIELGAYPDARCTKPPGEIERAIGRPPFLPETCVLISRLDRPTASIVLTLEPASELSNYGSWRIVDRQTGTMLASLTTSDTAENWIQSRGEPLSTAQQKTRPDCRAPYTELVDRIFGMETSSSSTLSHVLAEERVESSVDALQFVETDVKREVHPLAEEFLYTDAERSALFSPEVWPSEWQSAVNQGREVGTAAYGSRILDWKNRRLLSLSFTRRENPYPWHALATEDGFFVFSTAAAWHERPSNLLLRYRRDGSLAWAVNVVTPKKRGRSCNFWPQAIFVEGPHLVLADRCAEISNDESLAARTSAMSERKSGRGERWLIPLSDLPPLK